MVEVLNEADVPVSLVQDLESVVKDPHVNYRNMIQQIRLPSGELIKQIGFPVKFFQVQNSIRLPPPGLGEYNEEILLSLGYYRREIEGFKREQVV